MWDRRSAAEGPASPECGRPFHPQALAGQAPACREEGQSSMTVMNGTDAPARTGDPQIHNLVL